MPENSLCTTEFQCLTAKLPQNFDFDREITATVIASTAKQPRNFDFWLRNLEFWLNAVPRDLAFTTAINICPCQGYRLPYAYVWCFRNFVFELENLVWIIIFAVVIIILLPFSGFLCFDSAFFACFVHIFKRQSLGCAIVRSTFEKCSLKF